MTIGWGIIGLGCIAEDHIAPAINSFKGNILIAVVVRSGSWGSYSLQKITLYLQ